MRRLVSFGIMCLAAGFSTLATAQFCPPEGDGGDAILNRLKNRTTLPERYREMTVEGFFLNFSPNLTTPTTRDKFSAAHNQYVERRELEGVALVGNVLAVKQDGPDAATCKDETRRSLQLWIGGSQPPASSPQVKARQANAVVVKLTPAGQDAHPGWQLGGLNRLAKNRAKVRISGWALYDPAQLTQLGKTRGTLWEVHPVTKIEIWSDGQWREL